MRIEIECAMCGKGETESVDLSRVTLDAKLTELLADLLSKKKWIAQQNGAHLDLYCCKACAA